MIIFQLIQKPQKRGAEIFAAQLSENLQKLGHQVILISLFEGVCDLPFSGTIIYLNRPLQKRWFDIQGWKKIAELIKEFKPDLIQCNAGDTLKYAIISRLIFGWKTIPIVARNASTVSSYIRSGFIKKINSYLYAKVDGIICVSEHSKRDLNKLFLSTSHKSVVIPIGIDTLTTNYVEWKGSESFINVIHVGGFTFEKNHIGLLTIWESFLKVQPKAVLHLFGDGPLRKEIENMIIERRLESSIFLYGWVDNSIDYIAKSDVLILPSIIEGLPAVILEAMYCKTPVVANNVGGISEIINKQTGFLIEKGNMADFVQTLANILQHKHSDLLLNAFELVNGKYNNVSIAKEFEKAYKNILANKN